MSFWFAVDRRRVLVDGLVGGLDDGGVLVGDGYLSDSYDALALV